MNLNSLLCVTVLLLWHPFNYAVDMELEVIPLQNRSADEIVPILRPLIDEGGTVTGTNNQLIIKTTASNLGEIKQLLASIDTAARRLLITVRQDIEGMINTDQQGLSGRYKSGNISISGNNDRADNSGLVVSGQDTDGNRIRYRNLSTESKLDDKNTFTVQTIDGKPAYIQTGEQVPVPNRNAYITRNGVLVQDTIDYHDVTSGFYVLPRVSGERVTLLVAPQLSRVHTDGNTTFEVQNAETTTSGRLGEWLEIGGIAEQYNTNSKVNLSSTRQSGEERRSIYIKVEEIH
jgi:type II secretory pathway component GspD/PulD (secretin)